MSHAQDPDPEADVDADADPGASTIDLDAPDLAGVGPPGPAEIYRIVAVIKPFRAGDVFRALEAFDLEILGGTVREAMGYGRQKNRLHHYLGSEYDSAFLPKVELTLMVRGVDVNATVRAIIESARTGRMGDGKITVCPCQARYISW